MPITSLGQVVPVLGVNLGSPGAVSKIPNPVIASRPVNSSATLNLYFGDAAVVVPDVIGGSWLSVTDFLKTQANLANLAQYFAGFAVREVKTQLGYPLTYGGQTVGYYVAGEVGEVLEQGGILVPLAAGTPQANLPAYMRVLTNALVSTVIGGIEAAEDVAASTTATASAASTALTVASGTDILAGQAVVGNGIPANAYVTVVNGTAITISAATTVALAGGTPVKFTRTVPVPHCVFKTGNVDANNVVEVILLQRNSA